MRFTRGSRQQSKLPTYFAKCKKNKQFARNQLHTFQNYMKLITYACSTTHVVTQNNFL